MDFETMTDEQLDTELAKAPAQNDEFSGMSDAELDVALEAPSEAQPELPKYNLMSVENVRDNVYGDDRIIADATTNPNEIYSEESLKYFFKEQYSSFKDVPYDPVEIGRVIYNNENLLAQEIYGRVQQDIQNGEIEKRLANAEWTQYGFTDKIADKLTELNNSEFVEQLEFYTKAPAKGMVKAAAANPTPIL